MLETRKDLFEHLSTRTDVPCDYRIAVGLLLFTPDDKVLLLKRGTGARDARGQFEGVGGGLDENEDNLLRAIQREIREEIGDVSVSIDQTLGVKILQGESHPWWIVVDFLGRLESGEPQNMEPEKAEGLYTFALNEIDALDLSKYQRATMTAYRAKFGERLYYKI